MSTGDESKLQETLRIYRNSLGDLTKRFNLSTLSLDLSGGQYHVDDLAILKEGGEALQGIDLSRTNLGGGMKHIGALNGLVGIIMRGVHFPDTTELRYLAALPQLESLMVEKTNLNDAGMGALAPLFQGPSPRMKRFEASYTRVTSSGLGEIQSLRPGGSLVLSGLPVSADDIVRFRRLQLKRLIVGGPTITSELIEVLFEGFSKLEAFQVSDVSGCDEALTELQRRRPDLDIRIRRA